VEAARTILVVDDDKSILRTFTHILKKNGYEIDSAETGKEAMEKAASRHYDLALVDEALPNRNYKILEANFTSLRAYGFPLAQKLPLLWLLSTNRSWLLLPIGLCCLF